jgi:hypothetical protein
MTPATNQRPGWYFQQRSLMHLQKNNYMSRKMSLGHKVKEELGLVESKYLKLLPSKKENSYVYSQRIKNGDEKR